MVSRRRVARSSTSIFRRSCWRNCTSKTPESTRGALVAFAVAEAYAERGGGVVMVE